MIGDLQRQIIKLKEQLAALEERNDVIIDLLTESQLYELKEMDEAEDDSDDEEDEEAKEKRSQRHDEFMEWQMNLMTDYKAGKITHAQGMRMMQELYPEFTPDDKEGEDSFTDRMTVYNEVSEFKDVCGGDENLKFFHHMPYYQCWGGGPVGGFLEDEDSDEVHEVNRTWGEPYTIVKTYEDSKIELSRGDADTTETMLRIVSCKPVAITKDQERFRKIQICAA